MEHFVLNRFCLVSLLIITTLTTASCTLAHIWPYVNKRAQKSPVEQSKANYIIGDKEQKDKMFIGLALSGGGSRAANFASAAMLELKRLGILDRVDFISSVSGGSLPAAYYALDGYKYFTWTGYRQIHFEDAEVMDRMGRDFKWRWIGRWFLPQNMIPYWFTDFTRSDIMVQVFNNNLFHGASYADLNPERPKLLINATNDGLSDSFTFTDESFAEMNSSLASYKVARAVNVSSAFPGAFQSVTLRKYSPPDQAFPTRYLHLYDGGPVDNLGINTLLNVLKQAAKNDPHSSQFSNGCVIISVDASPRHIDHNGDQADIRGIPDYFLDRNALRATDTMLVSNRKEVLEKVGIPADKIDDEIFAKFPLHGNTDSCWFWHIALRHLPKDDFGNSASKIKTDFNIEHAEQTDLIEAAKRLVQEGVERSKGSGEISFLFSLQK
ncbi:MAG: patatin-like phospholipase family protein [Nitrospirae bacterium]|nr:patatin-like phospholipase family protein [Nitrospirota bacterium]